MTKIIILDPIAQEGLDLLARASGIEHEVRTGLKGEALKKALAEFDGAICRSGVTIGGDVLEGNRQLRAIARAGVGTDNIDKEAATRLGIVVMNTPTGNTLSTAEHTFTLMLALSRRMAEAYRRLLQGKWDRKTYMGTQLADKTLGIVGLGRIGQEVARRAQAFQMRVLGYDPFLSAEQAAKLGITRVEKVRDMLPHVDYLTVHTPLTPETTNLIDGEAIELMKPGVRLINCARGGIYNEAALVEGLKSGKLGGVALDVFAEEPNTTSPLFGMPNVLCTPHLGASTEEAQTQVAVEAVELLINYFTKGEVRHAVNMAAIDPKTLEAIRGYLDLAYRLGLLDVAVAHGRRVGLPSHLPRRAGPEEHAPGDGSVLCRPAGAGAGRGRQHRQRRAALARARHSADRRIAERAGGVQLLDVGRSRQRPEGQVRCQRHAVWQRHAASDPAG